MADEDDSVESGEQADVTAFSDVSDATESGDGANPTESGERGGHTESDDGSDPAPSRGATEAPESGGESDDSDPDPVEVGVELLSKLEHPELTVAEAVDRIETVTTHPATTRKILDQAEKRGVIEREDGVLKTTGGGYVSFQSEVVTKEGDFSCRRCGASISTGHFIKLDAGEHGAFGPECIRKVTGRD